MFASKIADADGKTAETQVWLDFSRDCGYLSKARHHELLQACEEVGKMLGAMLVHPEKFCRTTKKQKTFNSLLLYCILPTAF